MNQNLGRTKFLGFKSKEQLKKTFKAKANQTKLRVNGTQKSTEKHKTKLRQLSMQSMEKYILH